VSERFFPTPSPWRRRGFSIDSSIRAALVAVAVIASAYAAGGCSPGAGSGSPSGIFTASPGAAATPPATSGAATPRVGARDFPVTLRDQAGTSVTIAEEPDAVVSLGPATTETVFALGAGRKLVGGTDADDHPPEAKALPDVATYQGVAIEKVVALKPDVVLAAADLGQRPAADRLRSLGITVVVLEPRTVEEILEMIRLVGRAVGAGAEGEALTARMKARIEQISQAAAALRRPRVFYELGAEPDIYGLTEGSYTADLVRLAGGEPITTGSATDARMPLERLVAADPEVIVLGDANYGVTPEAVRGRPGGWSRTTAVRTGAIRPVDDIVVTRPGPRLAEGLAQLAHAIHPNLRLPGPAPAGTPGG
jgi:iron complex transport system substrate-binding protein